MPQNSPFTELILQIQERINTEIGTEIIRMVDEDKGQLESADKNGKPPVSFPCVLIDFTVLNIDDLGDGVQHVELMVQLRLGFPPFSVASSWMPTSTKLKALKYFDIEFLLFRALHGWAPAGFKAFMRRPPQTESREDTLRVRSLPFETSFEDTSAQPVRSTIPKNTISVTISPEYEQEEE